MTQNIRLQMPLSDGKNKQRSTNCITQGKQRRWINPYVFKLSNFKGRLFNFEDYQIDCQSIDQICLTKEKIFIEIGSGSGEHLIGVSSAEITGSFFGFEKRYKRAVRTIEKAKKVNLENLYVLLIDGKMVSDLFKSQTLDGVYVNFPDPWAKPKQRKHRLINQGFLEQLYCLLKPGGFFSFKTDHQEYFTSVINLLLMDQRFLITEQTLNLYSSSYIQHNIPTEFERLFCSQGQSICYLKILKKSLA